uniref:Macro domain-containing protein n=1 Tax=Chromera velia CCMP2878 TaxID=1169474 RepID=A0A0G4G2Y5_9ALVE|eukprot:Cvel_19961.t1-p1 / transcript=Cvel_19961.t1 / gene=Cvel_19961 / organism=Chromera_velia_CCMP2878 / gene_product=hypothetical protein / transcript_product=hypothetical protein / location=Cvel_scaffold1757:25452-26627(+) / protein_length=392 / sequence_SO=supercontig / SO=protein_coding / is_pseudo=false
MVSGAFRPFGKWCLKAGNGRVVVLSVSVTPCIVTSPPSFAMTEAGSSVCWRTLVCPGNEGLVGPKAAYFERGRGGDPSSFVPFVPGGRERERGPDGSSLTRRPFVGPGESRPDCHTADFGALSFSWSQMLLRLLPFGSKLKKDRDPPGQGRRETDSDSGAFSSSWGGMSVGSNMVFRSQTVDGMVDLVGGRGYREEVLRQAAERVCGRMSAEDVKRGVRCNVGQAVSVPPTLSSGPALHKQFDNIVHVVAPAWSEVGGNEEEWGGGVRASLMAGWREGVVSALSGGESGGCFVILTTPLIGAGTRGGGVERVCREAADAGIAFIEEEVGVNYRDDSDTVEEDCGGSTQPPRAMVRGCGFCISFALQNEETAKFLSAMIKERLKGKSLFSQEI